VGDVTQTGPCPHTKKNISAVKAQSALTDMNKELEAFLAEAYQCYCFMYMQVRSEPSILR